MNVSLTTSFDQLYSPQTLAEHNNRQHNIEAVSYITNGLFSVLINCMVLVVARMTKPYGKQMLLLSAFAFSVFLVSCGYLADGLRRVAYSNSRAGEMAIRQCFFVGVHLPLFYIGETAESFLLLHLSFDRFLAMISPAFYSRLNFQVTKRCFLTEYAVAVASSVTMMVIIVVLYGDDVILAQCYFGDAIPKPIKKLHNYWYIVSGFISIVAYIVAVACCCYRRKSTIGNRSAQCKREIKLTKRVALIVVTTFLSGVFPLTLLFVLPRNEQRSYIINWIMSFHSILLSLNVLVYACLIADFRHNLINSACCRKNRVEIQVKANEPKSREKTHG